MQLQGGWDKVGYISKMVQDTCTVSLKVEQEVVCALLSGDIADDLE